MAGITAVELGADTCVFARTSVRRGEVQVAAADVLDPAAFPGIDAFTTALRQTRRSLRLPRRCRAVVWGLPDGANRKDAAVKPLLLPLTGAGFKVERVVSPCNALAALARLKASRGAGSTCWVAINRGGVAIVVVRPGKQLYAHSFAWDSSVGASGSQARLLQRYSLVSFLSPEVKRAMAEARRYGTPVDAVVTCGNLPDLRSLTMPLIEELDVEVETLDSLEGLVVKPQAAEKLAEIAPGIRLACAAAIARGTRPWDPSKKRSSSQVVGTYVRAAALAAAVGGIGYLWYVKTGTPVTPPARGTVARSAPSAVTVPPPASKIDGRGSMPATPGNDPRPSVADPRTSAAQSNPPAVKTAPPAVTVPAVTKTTTPAPPPPPKVIAPAIPWRAPAVTAPSPAVNVPPSTSRVEARGSMPGRPGNDPRSSVPNPRTSPPPKSNPPVNATNTVPRAPMQPLVTMPSPNTPAPAAPRPLAVPAARPNPPAVSAPAAAPKPNPALNLPAAPADKPDAVSTSVSSPVRPPPRAPMPALLKDAVPRVTAILVSRDRRFATVDGGQIIGIGDLLGRRTVIGMDERSVVFQEPSGVQIRVGLGGRLLGVERGTR